MEGGGAEGGDGNFEHDYGDGGFGGTFDDDYGMLRSIKRWP